jgi:c-di-GMP-binding flagellar brake protein YcgR
VDQSGPRLERREFPRVPTTLDVEIALAGDERLLSASTVDLSLGGACLRTSRAFPDGETVLLAVSGPDRLVVAHGEVVACRALLDEESVEMRVRFVGLSRTRREALARLLRDSRDDGPLG